MTKYQNKYRIGSARLPNWDYRSYADYFATICAKNKKCFFGEIADTKKTIQCYCQKSAVTKNVRSINLYFAWQPRFYDHIIRNPKVFNKISNYIVNNPKNWDTDKFYLR